MRQKTWYNNIDKACSSMCFGETHGLLVGPSASNLVAELILTKIDYDLYEKGYRFIRNIDDYECAIVDESEAKRFLIDFNESLRQYDLNINYKKTEIIDLPAPRNPEWVHVLNEKNLIASYGKSGFKEVNSYLDTAVCFANQTNNISTIRYALKRLSSQELTDNGKNAAIDRGLHLAMIYPYLLPIVDQYIFEAYSVDAKRINRFVNAIYNDGIATNNYEEASYALYFSIKYRVNINRINTDWSLAHCDCINLFMTYISITNK